MSGLLRKEWLGWLSFTDAGKLVPVFLLALLLMWLLKLGQDHQRKLWVYSLVMGSLCVFPMTAALLMGYQTKFYDYEWIWTLVPLTAMIAVAGVLFAGWVMDKKDLSHGEKTVLLAATVCVLLLCGRLGNPEWTVTDGSTTRREIKELLALVKEGMEEEVCLWAPKEIMEQARSLDGDITLVYGRNMWQEHMNAFSYDSYTPEITRIFLWMEMAPIYGSVDAPVEAWRAANPQMAPSHGEILNGLECAGIAVSQGVNCILLPGNMQPEALEAFEGYLHTKAEKIGAYYLLRVEP